MTPTEDRAATSQVVVGNSIRQQQGGDEAPRGKTGVANASSAWQTGEGIVGRGLAAASFEGCNHQEEEEEVKGGRGG